MATIAERAAAIAAKARDHADTRRDAKPKAPDEPTGSGFPLRSWWTVYRWNGEPPLDVFVYPPMGQLDVKATFYPDAAGVFPRAE